MYLFNEYNKEVQKRFAGTAILIFILLIQPKYVSNDASIFILTAHTLEFGQISICNVVFYSHVHLGKYFLLVENYDSSLQILNKLGHVHPNDAKIQHNKQIIHYTKAGYKNTEEFVNSLKEICRKVCILYNYMTIVKNPYRTLHMSQNLILR